MASASDLEARGYWSAPRGCFVSRPVDRCHPPEVGTVPGTGDPHCECLEAWTVCGLAGLFPNFGPAFRDTAEYSRSQRMTCVVRWSSMWSSWNHACLDSYRLRVVGSGIFCVSGKPEAMGRPHYNTVAII